MADETQTVDSRLAAVRSLGHLPGTLDELAVHAGRQGDVLSDAALEALSRSEEPVRALSLLLTHGRGLASPVAVAAMGRCCAVVPPSRLGPLLEQALTGPASKVTVRKQAVRLLERHRPPGAVDVLLRAWRNPDLHKDVRIAVAVALRQLPGSPEARESLAEVADRFASGEMLRALFQPSPWDFAPEHRPGYAALVRRLLAVARAPGVRYRGIKAFGMWVHCYQGGVTDIVAAVADPSDPSGAEQLPLFLAFMHAEIVHDEVVEVAERLVLAGPNTEARRRLSRIARDLPGHGASERGHDLAERLARLL
ncbi:HEAT repeat domain-containing protein, partial [Actinomadura adrarensis]